MTLPEATTSPALNAPRPFAADLRREAEARFDWRAIAERLAGELEAMGTPAR